MKLSEFVGIEEIVEKINNDPLSISLEEKKYYYDYLKCMKESGLVNEAQLKKIIDRIRNKLNK